MIAIIVHSDEAQSVLRIIGSNLDDLSKPFTAIGERLLDDARSEIDGQGFGGWGGMSPWTTFVAMVLSGRERAPGTLLKDSGGLVDSLNPGDQRNIFEVAPMEASFGSRYTSPRSGFGIAKGQQEGTSRTFHVLQGEGFSETGIPGRVFISWRGDRLDEYDAILADHVVEGVE